MFGRKDRPVQAEDRHWQRLQELAADLAEVRGTVRTLTGEWSDTLSRVNKAIQRLERAQERADRRNDTESVTPGSPRIATEGEGLPEGRGFAAKLAAVNGRRS